MKIFLLYLSFLSAFVSDARYTTSEVYLPDEAWCGYDNIFDEVQNMDITPSFRSVNTCAMVYGLPAMERGSAPAFHTAPMTVANGTIRTMASDTDNGTPAAIQPLYVMQYAAPSVCSVRRTPGVPSRAPIGDALCPLLLCAAVYTLCIGHHRAIGEE